MNDGDAQCPKVKCATCGFLAGKLSEEPELLMVSPRWRKTGVPDGPNGMEHAPHCFRGVTEPNDEYHALKIDGAEKRTIFLGVIGTERACAKYRAFDPGYTPKEHAEMDREERLRAEQQQQRERDLAFQEDRRRFDEARRADDRAEAEARRAQDKEHAERVRREDQQWKAEQDRKQWLRSIYSGIMLAVLNVSLATLLAVIAEPWKAKQPVAPVAPPPVAKS